MRTEPVLDALEMTCGTARRFATGLSVTATQDRRPCSIGYTERLAESGAAPLIGFVGDRIDNAVAESTIGLYVTELIRRHGSWPRRPSQLATLAPTLTRRIGAVSTPMALNHSDLTELLEALKAVGGVECHALGNGVVPFLLIGLEPKDKTGAGRGAEGGPHDAPKREPMPVAVEGRGRECADHNLRARRLTGVELVFSDAPEDLKVAIPGGFVGTSEQWCRVHFMPTSRPGRT